MTHYEQRLRTLHYKKKFTIWLNELRPKIQAVLEASKEVQRSKRLKRMLELILAFGNYMNRGQRGNAHGFKLNSLTRIADTKSSCNKNMTLLHFMADTCEQKVQISMMVVMKVQGMTVMRVIFSWHFEWLVLSDTISDTKVV